MLSTKFFRIPLLQRIFLFVIVFVFISGVSGSWLISQKTLLFPFYFSIYGSAGKVILFSIVSFLMLTKDRVLKLKITQFAYFNFIALCTSLLSLILFFIFAQSLIPHAKFSDVPLISLLAHSMLWLSGLTATIAVFGWKVITQVRKEFRKELLISSIIAIVFYFSFSSIFKLWPYLSGIVLVVVSKMLSLTVSQVIIIRPLTLQLPNFAVTIGEYCSGIESLFLISVLYVMIGCLERNRLRMSRYFLLFPLLLCGMFVLNIVRVYLIIQAGIWISPQIAAKLFHTYLGMILFMVYFFFFWKWSAPILLKSTIPKGKGKL